MKEDKIVVAGFPGVGKHYLQALEKQFNTSSAATFFGAAGRFSALIANIEL